MMADLDWHSTPLDDGTVIDASYRNTQNVRRYFKRKIGDHFTMNRTFMAWMRANQGETLGAACAAWLEIKEAQT